VASSVCGQTLWRGGSVSPGILVKHDWSVRDGFVGRHSGITVSVWSAYYGLHGYGQIGPGQHGKPVPVGCMAAVRMAVSQCIDVSVFQCRVQQLAGSWYITDVTVIAALLDALGCSWILLELPCKLMLQIH
jgi:hypothetical protein